MALTRKGAPFVWTDRQQTVYEALKAGLISAPIPGFPTEDGRFLLDTDSSLFAVGGFLNQIQDEVVIAYASRSLRLSQRRLFAVGDWVLRYYSPAKKCKLDSAWVGPYLVVSLAGWALGIQRHPDSPLILVHCQDLKKIPRASGLVSWIEAPLSKGAPTIPVLGASTMARTSQGSPSVAVLPPDEGAILADVDSVGSAGSLSGSRADCPNASVVDVSSASLSSAVVPFSQTVLQVNVPCDLHPFFAHKLDAGPIWLVTIAHAFNYRVAVLRDGVTFP